MSTLSPKKILANAALAGMSLLFTAVLLDVALRFIYPPPVVWNYPQEYYEYDAEIAHVLRPNQHGYTHDKPISVNSHGLRDREYAAKPESGVRRVLAIGDSQTFGNGVALEDSWPKQVEQRLNENASTGGNQRWEVLNAGIPGTDSWQHEIWMGRLLEVYHPDAVVLAVYVNDVSPSYVPKQRKAGDKTNTFKKRVGYLAKRSALVNLILQRLAARAHAHRMSKGRAVSEFILTGVPNERIERGWEQVDRSLAAMQAECSKRGIAFLVAILPRRDQVSGEQPARIYNDRVASIARSHGVDSIDVLPDLCRAYEEYGAQLFIPWDGHNSPIANRVIGTKISERLSSLGSLMAAR